MFTLLLPKEGFAHTFTHTGTATSFPMQLACCPTDLTLAMFIRQHGPSFFVRCTKVPSCPTRTTSSFVLLKSLRNSITVVPSQGQGTSHGAARVITYHNAVPTNINAGKTNGLFCRTIDRGRRHSQISCSERFDVPIAFGSMVVGNGLNLRELHFEAKIRLDRLGGLIDVVLCLGEVARSMISRRASHGVFE